MLTINNTSRRKRYRIYLRLLQYSLTSSTSPSHRSPRPILDVPKSLVSRPQVTTHALTHASQCPRPLVPAPVLYTAVDRYTCSINAFGLKGFLSKMMFHCVKSHQKFIHFMGYYMLTRLCIKTFHRVL